MSGRWGIVLGIGLLVLMTAVSLAVVFGVEFSPSPAAKAPGPERTRNFGEDIRLLQHGLYGVELVSIGKAHMRKVRRGPFRIGALNELVLENVELVLPEELWKEAAAGGGALGTGGSAASASDRRQDLRAMLARLGIESGHLRLGGVMPRFSALDIRRLRVARLDGTNAVPWFAASGAEGERGGLHLREGWSVENGVSNVWHEAFLAVDGKIALHPLQ